MSKSEKNIIKTALDYFFRFSEAHNDLFVFHDHRFASDGAGFIKEIAKAEDIPREEYEPAVVAFILSFIGSINSSDSELNNENLKKKFYEENTLSEEEIQSIEGYISFIHSNKIAQTNVEEVLKDGMNLFLALPDSLEKLSLLRYENEKLLQKVYDDLDWLQQCKEYFLRHGFYTKYASKNYGAQRNKNYVELEKMIEKLKFDLVKAKRPKENHSEESISGKESEDLFKIAFRNYVNLVALADRKAGLLIQVNSIIATVIIGFVLKTDQSLQKFIIPVAVILLVDGITILFGILASKPLSKAFLGDINGMHKEPFFFGSFDKLDRDFLHTTWDQYSADMNELLSGDKNLVIDELVKESFHVRKVLAKKFNYLDMAYKFFFTGLVVVIITFLIAIFLQDS